MGRREHGNKKPYKYGTLKRGDYIDMKLKRSLEMGYTEPLEHGTLGTSDLVSGEQRKIETLEILNP